MATEINPRKRTRYIWPEEAKRLVAKALRGQNRVHAVLLHNQLEELTGFSSFACWRFLERQGIRRPGAGTYRTWDTFAVAEYVMEHGYEAAAKKFACPKSTLYNVMWRVDRTLGHCSGHYGLNQLRKMFSVRVQTVLYWIKTGLLEATPVMYGGKETFVVSDEQLRRFVSREAGSLILRRFPEKRAEFLSNYLYTEKHMNLGLTRTRESKKEEDAYREYLSANAS